MKTCARCEKPIRGKSVVRDAPPYQGGTVCNPCERAVRSGTVPAEPEPLPDSVSRECLADVLRRLRVDVVSDSTSSITWRDGALWALGKVAQKYGIPLDE